MVEFSKIIKRDVTFIREMTVGYPAIYENSLVLRFEMPAPQLFLVNLKDFSK